MTSDRKIQIILCVVAIVSIIFAIFALNKAADVPQGYQDVYKTQIRTLEDSISILIHKGDSLQKRVVTLESKSKETQIKIVKVEEDEKETNFILDNGGWDANIRFLSDYLSAKGLTGF